MMVMIILVFTVGAAYAAVNQSAAGTGEHLSNGITYFDLRHESTCNNLVGSVEQDAAKPLNVITAFDIGKTGVKVQSSCTTVVSQTIMNKGNNGITVF